RIVYSISFKRRNNYVTASANKKCRCFYIADNVRQVKLCEFIFKLLLKCTLKYNVEGQCHASPLSLYITLHVIGEIPERALDNQRITPAIETGILDRNGSPDAHAKYGNVIGLAALQQAVDYTFQIGHGFQPWCKNISITVTVSAKINQAYIQPAVMHLPRHIQVLNLALIQVVYNQNGVCFSIISTDIPAAQNFIVAGADIKLLVR